MTRMLLENISIKISLQVTFRYVIEKTVILKFHRYILLLRVNKKFHRLLGIFNASFSRNVLHKREQYSALTKVQSSSLRDPEVLHHLWPVYGVWPLYL